MAVRVLRYVNSPNASVPGKATSACQAVKLLGTSTIKSLALSISLVLGQERVPCEGFAYDPFWSESVARGVAARHICQLSDEPLPDDGFACGLLSQVGCLAFAAVYPRAYGHLLCRAGAHNQDGLLKLERETFEIDHNQLAAELFNDWGLLAEYGSVVRCQDEVGVRESHGSSGTARLARVLRLAHSIAVILVRQRTDLVALNRLVNNAGRVGIGPTLFHTAFDSIACEWRNMAAIFAVSRRTMPPLAGLYSEAYAAQRSAGQAPLIPGCPDLLGPRTGQRRYSVW